MATNEIAHTWARTGAATVQGTARAKPTILIAEDNADSREMMRLLLETKGYEIVWADDGLQAFDVALRSLPDLVLIDLEMPKVDGLTITRNLRARPELSDVPIIIVSGHDPAMNREAALSAGCNDYLLKPIDFDRLDEILDEMIPHPARHGQGWLALSFRPPLPSSVNNDP
jgi:CheY-like chemotaxis protein